MNFHYSNFTRWTDERISLLRALWADGYSASQIAVELGGITRNAVIGKVHRLHITERDKQPKHTSRSQGQKVRQERSRQERSRQEKARDKRYLTPAERKAQREERRATAERTAAVLASEDAPRLTAEERARAVTLLQLNDHTCRWPLGNPASPGFLFCGAEPIHERPYCAAHHAMSCLGHP